MRLAPLVQVEAALLRRILPPRREDGSDGDMGTGSGPGSGPGTSVGTGSGHEICVNSTSLSWRGALGIARLLGNKRESTESGEVTDWADPDDPGVVMCACAEDMKRLWADPVVQRMMASEKMRPEEMAGL